MWHHVKEGRMGTPVHHHQPASPPPSTSPTSLPSSTSAPQPATAAASHTPVITPQPHLHHCSPVLQPLFTSFNSQPPATSSPTTVLARSKSPTNLVAVQSSANLVSHRSPSTQCPPLKDGADLRKSPPTCRLILEEEEDEVELLDYNSSPERGSPDIVAPVSEKSGKSDKTEPARMSCESRAMVEEGEILLKAAMPILRHASYKDAVKSHSTRFWRRKDVVEEGWTEVTTRRSKEATNRQYNPARGQVQQPDLLQLLRTKASGRCFNCFARDHRIAQCRDPPRCVLCSRSGHKAKLCPSHPRPSRSPPAQLHCNAVLAARLSQPQHKLPSSTTLLHPYQPLHSNPTIAARLSNKHFTHPLHSNPELAARLCDKAWPPLRAVESKKMEDMIPGAPNGGWRRLRPVLVIQRRLPAQRERCPCTRWWHMLRTRGHRWEEEL